MKQTRTKLNIATGEGLIIEKSDAVSSVRRMSEWTYNLLAWAFWFFLLRPIIIGALWYLGVRLAYYQMITLQGVKNPDFFTCSAGGVALIFVVMLLWNRYNVYRFRGVERRRSRGECSVQEMADFYHCRPENIESLSNSRNIDIYFKSREEIEADCGNGVRFPAVYAPQNPKLQMAKAKPHPSKQGA